MRKGVKSRIEEHGSSGLYISNKTPSTTTRKWILSLPTEDVEAAVEADTYSVESDHAEKLRILNDQSSTALRLISDLQSSSERRFENLERALSDQNELITKLQEENKSLKSKTENQENIIYQLLGGLFNQRDQANILSSHIADLYGEDFEDLSKDSSKWSVFPTTRQGDALEQEVAKQAEQIKSLVDLLRKTNNTIDSIDALQCYNSEAISKKLNMLEDETSAVQKATGELIVNQLEDKRRMLGHITSLDARTNRQEAVIGKVVNGLFGTDQQKSKQEYLDLLYGRVSQSTSINTSKWDSSPTTPQGDLTERKMAVFEKHLKSIKSRLETPLMEFSD
jgi:predicted  nucleic acid-binding Zn-ribbon protein